MKKNTTKFELLKSPVNNAGDARFYLSDDVMARWQPDVHAAADTGDATINIYDVIGEDYFTGAGMTGKVVSSILRKNQGKAITVNINSPGGLIFEGITIYNLLKEHDGEININIVGVAASIASIIAMAGDNIKIADSAFLMIHNGWNCVCGNKNDMREMADTLDQFDKSMVAIYSKQSGIDEKKIAKMMDAETWISGPDAIEMGLATAALDSDGVEVEDNANAKYNNSLKEVDVALQKAGHTRSQRRAMLKDLTSTPRAIGEEEATPRAGNNHLQDAMVAFGKTLQNLK